MTTERLELANRIYDRLEKLKENKLRFQQESVDFDFMHTKHPWCMLTDEEWEKLKNTIKDRYESETVQLSLKFAEL